MIAYTPREPVRFDPAQVYPPRLAAHSNGGWRLSAAERAAPVEPFRSLLEAGYGVLSVDLRGHGERGGTVRLLDDAFAGGDAQIADNARAITEAAPVVAARREPVDSGDAPGATDRGLSGSGAANPLQLAVLEACAELHRKLRRTRTLCTLFLLPLLALAACSPEQAADRAHLGDLADAGPAGKSWRDPQPPADPPANQPPAGPALLARAAEERVYAEGRGRDQANNPEYQALTAPYVVAVLASGGSDPSIAHDPFRVAWSVTRGMEQDVQFRNRYGATMAAKLWGPKQPYTDPVTGVVESGPFPAVLFMPGRFSPSANSLYSGFGGYEGQAQQLAENGYIVLAVGPQGQDGSEYFTPPHPLCDPRGAWTQPQELGLRELGDCAGQEAPFAGFSGDNAALYNTVHELTGDDRPGFLLQAYLEDAAVALDQRAANYDEFQTRFVFAALDGAAFLLSADNPWRGMIDAARVGIVGHSAGGHAALVAGNGDPQQRFKAAVAWDSYGYPPDTVAPRVPTMIQMAERQNEFGPYSEAPPNHLWPPYRAYQRFVAEDQPAMLLTLRGSTHHEWSYVPQVLTNPVSPLQNASSKGAQVGFYYTLAWLDYWLKPSTHRADAQRRLLARRFDASADRSSIGSGTFDFASQSNAPYRIEGEDVADHLSVLFLSQLAFDGAHCNDMQAACEQ
ncbi:MAG TPA: prolyl oligopeptidase family serine peptidase [Nevskiaceae bacterium]|nr:prolyl oligopeptidase family serine peptidase [Nevskiaceae bacterium]